MCHRHTLSRVSTPVFRIFAFEVIVMFCVTQYQNHIPILCFNQSVSTEGKLLLSYIKRRRAFVLNQQSSNIR